MSLESPDWSAAATRERVVRMIRYHGVTGEISFIPGTGDDELFFVISSTDAASVRLSWLADELMGFLRRKVAIITDASAWPETPVPLSEPRSE